MNGFSSHIRIEIHDSIYLKNPETSELGIKIISGSIDLISELGFENFTFKKLAASIKSTEASVYRYFESKHQLLVYLANWHWSWIEYRLAFGLANIPCSSERLEKAIRILTSPIEIDHSFSHVDEVKLNQIVIQEFSKIYLKKQIERDNKEGYFASYKAVVERVSYIVNEINPKFKYPTMLISTIIEGAHHQRLFAQHLPRLTNTIAGEDAVAEFYVEMIFKTIQS